MQNTGEETRREHEDKNLIEQSVSGKDREMKSSKEEDTDIKRSKEDDRVIRLLMKKTGILRGLKFSKRG